MKYVLAALAFVFLTGCAADTLTDAGDTPHLAGDVVSASKAGSRSALEFDGVDDYVRIPDDPSLDLTTLSIAAWVYIDAYEDWSSVVTKGSFEDDPDFWGSNNYTLHQVGGKLAFTSQNGLAGFSNTQIPLQEWHHVAVTYDGATVRFYLDGQADGEGAITPAPSNDDPLHIGADFPGAPEFWDGRIDEVRLWNAALTPAQVRASVYGHAAPLGSALVGYWRFDEGSGTTAGDRSAHGNDGTLVNGPTWITPGAPLDGGR